MKYIIENAVVNENGQEEKRSFLIESTKVTYCNKYFSKYTFMRMNAESFLIAPGYVMIDFNVATLTDFQQFKERMKHLHTIGCTTLITACEVQYESQFLSDLMKTKHRLINSSLDFVVAAKIPLRILTDTFIRKCCKWEVPIIFVEITSINEIYTINWQRIRDELFPYHCYIVPLWNLTSPSVEFKNIRNEWVRLLTENKIATQSTAPLEQIPISKQFLVNVGLYPKKGSLNTGSDADYLLYSKERGNSAEANVIQQQPDVVFATGKVQKAGRNVIFEPGCGKEIQIKAPRKFVPISQAFKPQSIPVDYY